jgi:hypothetical protein
MLPLLDRRVIPEIIIDLIRSVQTLEPCHLAGGAALSGAHLAHRLSADVDLFVLFLDRAGFRPEDDLVHALRKDAGIDPATLAWLLESFPVSPLPKMLLPLRRFLFSYGPSL